MLVSYTTPPCMGCDQSSVVPLEDDKYARWKLGAFIQQVWPEKSDEERELIMTGTHPACWNEMFSDEED